jgi:hypothetical protein
MDKSAIAAEAQASSRKVFIDFLLHPKGSESPGEADYQLLIYIYYFKEIMNISAQTVVLAHVVKGTSQRFNLRFVLNLVALDHPLDGVA